MIILENIYHICSRIIWEQAKNGKSYQSESLEKEGFIHCSKYDQVLRVANDLFSGQKNLLLLEIDQEKVKPEILWESGIDKPDDLFPHIYGSLNMDAVLQVFDLCETPDGKFHLPSKFVKHGE